MISSFHILVSVMYVWYTKDRLLYYLILRLTIWQASAV